MATGEIIPETWEQAKHFVEDGWSKVTALQADFEVEFRQCDALIDFRVESRRVLPASQADQLATGKEGIIDVIQILCLLPGSRTRLRRSRRAALEGSRATVEGLREGAMEVHEYRNDLQKAAEYLKQAANLLGVREEIFVSKPLASGTGHEPPRIEGETEQEYTIRNDLCKLVHGIRDDFRKPVHGLPMFAVFGGALFDRVLTFDRRHGGGSGSAIGANKLAIRMLWDAWPEALRETVKGVWRPNLKASQILQYCGHDVSSNDIGRYKDQLKSDTANAKRRKHEVPGR